MGTVASTNYLRDTCFIMGHIFKHLGNAITRPGEDFNEMQVVLYVVRTIKVIYYSISLGVGLYLQV